jgi:hypothetical protein
LFTLSAFDLTQDIFGIIISLLNPWLLLISIPMTLGDLLSMYIVLLEKPFIFFESELLESSLLIGIMCLDVAFDFYWLVIWLFVSADNKFFIAFALFSLVVFLADLYQVYTYIFEYGDDEAFEEEERKMQEEFQ